VNDEDVAAVAAALARVAAAVGVVEVGCAAVAVADVAARGVAGATAARAAAFQAGRAATRRALAQLGVHAAVDVDVDGLPVFPAATSGSIAHASGVAVAIAVPGAVAVGVDVDTAGAPPPHLAELVLTSRERQVGLDVRRAFAIKEAAYKAWCVVDGAAVDDRVDFTDIEVAGDVADVRGVIVDVAAEVVAGVVVAVSRARATRGVRGTRAHTR
jgi:4'-phosphopantetheinyl transferase EntD